MFDDFSEFDDRDAPSTMTRTFRYGTTNLSGRGNAVLDAGSFKPTGPSGLARAAKVPHWASNFLLVSGKRSSTGPPAVRRRPADRLHVPRAHARGRHQLAGRAGARRDRARASPGNILIGRGQDYAWTLTSAGSDLVDTYVETLCGGSRTKYRYKGRCRTMGRVDAGTITGLRAGRLPHDRARAGDRLREGQGPHRGRLPQARELRAGRAVAARRSGT